MSYTISQVAEKFDLTAHTIRYYDKEGLLPFVERSKSGSREFSDSDLEWLKLICCLKNTGMPLKQIKQYIEWCLQGDETLEIRRQLFLDHRKEVLKQMADLRENLKIIDFKLKIYDTGCNIPTHK
ncbi:MerR family transcriptional regulator [Desulfosporosinus meridiei]|uniref:Putative transcriptional regulator n=1 Tax=Desulfosporosinus meridiei (strain ATCC BAA-275 / DSM 13257 / KCTC 12902 / NCIMB 13706 / S10) TaxID=768704 RepID=J7ITN8_DESMD|nr:MerR family transcriptional regulator [Desulfosporosinus meridiei]AFQ42468.1 putative transcriptional regulator [Desulfosporosinus meridiei DSM 13257]